MVLTGISEFTFGFAFLHEQTNRHFAGLMAVPILPSLQQEANAGWDARIPINGVPNYYQFKLSDYLHRRNAKYIADGTYVTPYYRFALHRRNNNQQHNRLRELSASFPETYYVAPELDDIELFNQAFMNSHIFDNSRIISLDQCRDIYDGDQHYVTYQAGNPNWIEHSEPIKHERSFSGKISTTFSSPNDGKWLGLTNNLPPTSFEGKPRLPSKYSKPSIKDCLTPSGDCSKNPGSATKLDF